MLKWNLLSTASTSSLYMYGSLGSVVLWIVRKVLNGTRGNSITYIFATLSCTTERWLWACQTYMTTLLIRLMTSRPMSGKKNVATTLPYYYAHWVWICTVGLDFAFFSIISSSFPPEFCEIVTCICWLWIYEITKGYKEGKLMRKGCRSIKSRAILGIALVLSRDRFPSPRKIQAHFQI
jgi:hypothetical protein